MLFAAELPHNEEELMWRFIAVFLGSAAGVMYMASKEQTDAKKVLSNEIFSLKQDLAHAMTQLRRGDNNQQSLQQEINRLQRRIIDLEARKAPATV